MNTPSAFTPAAPADDEWAPAPPECMPDLEALITEDHQPVDRILLEKQYRLLTRPLYASWAGPAPGRPFLALVNVGWFYKDKTPPVAPDFLLSLDVDCPKDLHTKEGHSYYQWVVGKSPEAVLEVVSNRTGGEEVFKKNLYERLGVAYYAVYDPERILGENVLRAWQLHGGKYQAADPGFWPEIGLGLTLWQGTFEGHADTWLRWRDESGQVIPTGEERAQRERERAEKAEQRVRELEEALRARDGQP